MGLPWRYQALCEWQQEEVRTRLAYSAQHLGGVDRFQSIKGGCVGTWERWISIIANGVIIPLS